MNDEKNIYPLAIIGSGLAGLTASLYASRYQIPHILIGKDLGGKIIEAISIENYPGFKKISGLNLIKRIKDQILFYKPSFVLDKVKEIRKYKNYFLLTFTQNRQLKAQYLILALGTVERKLGIKGEKQYLGKGVHFCPTCDGYFYKDKIVAVIGGGDSGVTSALYLADLAKRVYLIESAPYLGAMPFWQSKIREKNNIKILLNSKVLELLGRSRLEKIKIKQKKHLKVLFIDGIFVKIGTIPNNRLAKQIKLKLDKKGYVKVNSEQKTSDPKIFAAGDITTGSNYFQQIITASAEGAIASHSVFKELNKGK